jgi:hypothetical protein
LFGSSALAFSGSFKASVRISATNSFTEGDMFVYVCIQHYSTFAQNFCSNRSVRMCVGQMLGCALPRPAKVPKVQCQKDWISVAAQHHLSSTLHLYLHLYLLRISLFWTWLNLLANRNWAATWMAHCLIQRQVVGVPTWSPPQLSIELDQILLHKNANSGSSDIRKTCISDLPGES